MGRRLPTSAFNHPAVRCLLPDFSHTAIREFQGRGGILRFLNLPFASSTADGAHCDYAQILGKYENFAGLWLVGEDLPQASNGVALHSTEEDRSGLSAPVIHFLDHSKDVAMRIHAFRSGRAIYKSLNAESVFELPPGPSTRNMGTCRQSEKPGDGVCNGYGQCHDVPNLFISDGSEFTSSSAENPTLAIVLAIRQARHLADKLNRDEM